MKKKKREKEREHKTHACGMSGPNQGFFKDLTSEMNGRR
jgi:hypothetical protein